MGRIYDISLTLPKYSPFICVQCCFFAILRLLKQCVKKMKKKIKEFILLYWREKEIYTFIYVHILKCMCSYCLDTIYKHRVLLKFNLLIMLLYSRNNDNVIVDKDNQIGTRHNNNRRILFILFWNNQIDKIVFCIENFQEIIYLFLKIQRQ